MPLQHIIFYDWKHYLKSFGLCGAVKPGEAEGDLNIEYLNYSLMMVFVEQPLALPSSANKDGVLCLKKFPFLVSDQVEFREFCEHFMKRRSHNPPFKQFWIMFCLFV